MRAGERIRPNIEIDGIELEEDSVAVSEELMHFYI